MKKILSLFLFINSIYVYADNPRIMGNTNNMFNNPTVNSRLYSGALFTEQNQLTNAPSNYNKKESSNIVPNFSKNNMVSSNYLNSPNVNSNLYSGALFEQQNQLTKPTTLSTNNQSLKLNNPNVNSRLYSGTQFPEQNILTN